MRKKLNLVLREPVKLHETEAKVPELSARFETEEIQQVKPEREKPKLAKTGNGEISSKPAKINERLENKLSEPQKTTEKNTEKTLESMPPRVRQIWDYFCEAAKKDGELRNSFVITRSEVMRQAGIGSTNTYRDALRKFQTAGLIEIELRPGVNSGSIFYLTEKGIELAKK